MKEYHFSGEEPGREGLSNLTSPPTHFWASLKGPGPRMWLSMRNERLYPALGFSPRRVWSVSCSESQDLVLTVRHLALLQPLHLLSECLESAAIRCTLPGCLSYLLPKQQGPGVQQCLNWGCEEFTTIDWIPSTECKVKRSSPHPQLWQLRAGWGVDPRTASKEQGRDEVKGAQELENLDW